MSDIDDVMNQIESVNESDIDFTHQFCRSTQI